MENVATFEWGRVKADGPSCFQKILKCEKRIFDEHTYCDVLLFGDHAHTAFWSYLEQLHHFQRVPNDETDYLDECLEYLYKVDQRRLKKVLEE